MKLTVAFSNFASAPCRTDLSAFWPSHHTFHTYTITFLPYFRCFLFNSCLHFCSLSRLCDLLPPLLNLLFILSYLSPHFCTHRIWDVSWHRSTLKERTRFDPKSGSGWLNRLFSNLCSRRAALQLQHKLHAVTISGRPAVRRASRLQCRIWFGEGGRPFPEPLQREQAAGWDTCS